MEIQIRHDVKQNKQIQMPCPEVQHGTKPLHYTVFDIAAGTHLDFMAHWHTEYEIVLQLDGYSEFRIDETLYHVTAGQALFFNGNSVHGHADPYSYYGHYLCFSFGEDFLFPDPNSHIYNRFFMPIQSGQYTFTKHLSGRAPYETDILSILNILASLKNNIPDNALSIQICLLRIFEIMLRENAFDPCRKDTAKQTLIKSALWYIGQNYTSPISIRDISGFLSISPDHFSRLFKLAIGSSPKEYIQDLRIRHAIHEMTAHPDYSLSEIAAISGFSESNYFARIFKSKLGVSPSNYHKYISNTGSK